MYVDFQTRRLGPLPEDHLDLIRRFPLPAEPAVMPAPFSQGNPLPCRALPAGLDPLLGGAPGRALVPVHFPLVDPRPELVKRFEFPAVQVELASVGLARHQQDVDMDMLGVAVDRHQGRVVLEMRLLEKLPGHGQRFIRGDAFLEGQDHPVIPPASPALLCPAVHLFGGRPLAVQRVGAQDGMLGQVPGFPAVARPFPQDVAGIGPGPAGDRTGSHLAER